MHSALLPLVAGVLFFCSAGPGVVRARPIDIFADLDGTWVGTFVGYDATGTEVLRIKARHTYRTVSATRQTVRIEDTMPGGEVIIGRGANLAERTRSGSLLLRCVIEKSDGESIDHAGRVVRGPDGGEQIVWYTTKPQRVETFREVIRREDGELVYEINGMGLYGKTLVLMVGRYRKVGADDNGHVKENG